MRSHRMCGVADENDAVPVPRRWHQRVLERTPDHPLRRTHAFAYFDYDRRGEILEHILENYMRLAFVDPRIGRKTQGREQIHPFIAQRNKAGLQLWSDEDVKLIDGRMPLGHESEYALSDIGRLMGLAED